jgi:hypothetical protein
VLDLTDASVRRWWLRHSFTTGVVSGILVLALTILIVDRVVDLRGLRDRSRAIAAQAAILMTQATRAANAVSSMLADSGEDGADRDSASDELRTYMSMLLVSAPLLIDARPSRTFLEQAQRLAGEMAQAFGIPGVPSKPPNEQRPGLAEALDQMRTASIPLLQILDLDQLVAVGSEDVVQPPKA